MKTRARPLRILVAVDGSAAARAAAVFSAARCARGRGEMRAVAVAPPFGRAPRPDAVAVIEAAQRHARDVLANGRRLWGNAATVVEAARPEDGILRQAERCRAGLIALGSRGLSPMKAFFLGSVSRAVARRSRRPVLAVNGAIPLRGLRVLLATDGTPPARRAARFLSSMGLPRDTRVTVFSAVVDPLAAWVPEAGYGGLYPGGPGTAAVMSRLRASADRRLDEARRTLQSVFRRVRCERRDGRPAAEILAAAARTRAHLVVLGARGLSPLDRFWLGSVSQSVFDRARTSVLIVP